MTKHFFALSLVLTSFAGAAALAAPQGWIQSKRSLGSQIKSPGWGSDECYLILATAELDSRIVVNRDRAKSTLKVERTLVGKNQIDAYVRGVMDTLDVLQKRRSSGVIGYLKTGMRKLQSIAMDVFLNGWTAMTRLHLMGWFYSADQGPMSKFVGDMWNYMGDGGFPGSVTYQQRHAFATNLERARKDMLDTQDACYSLVPSECVTAFNKLANSNEGAAHSDIDLFVETNLVFSQESGGAPQLQVTTLVTAPTK